MEATARVAQAQGVSGYKGLFYHFLTNDAATRFKTVELSTIDTGLLMAGVLSTLSYYDRNNATERKIRKLADALYRRVEWDWMLNDEGVSAWATIQKKASSKPIGTVTTKRWYCWY
ncbi:MAG: hypothetical protein R2795_01440 [Saprospiraceae bacterium]